MTDQTELPSPDFEQTRRGLTLVWIMPLLAVIVALGVVWRSYSDLGPLILVRFPDAAGIKVDETPLRYRDVEVGQVEGVSFSGDLRSVDVAIRVDKAMAPFIDSGASFWLVQPEVSARGITGLDTVLSGVYIEGSWDGVPGERTSEFNALERPPLARPGETGTQITLRSSDGRQLAAGAPILFNGIEVGRIGTPSLSDDGAVVTMSAFVTEPHDQRLTTATSFWDSSGFTIGLDTGGVSVDVDSLAALIEGGISFGTLVSGGTPVEPGHVFEIFGSEEDARTSVFSGTANYAAAILLENNVAGLTRGANVRYQGIKVGEVQDISGFVDPDDAGRGVQLLARLQLNPRRLGIEGTSDSDAITDALADRVENGLRARLSSEGLLGQTIVVELLDLPTAGLATLRTDLTTQPLLPTVEASLTDSSATVDGLVERVNNLPIEDVMTSAIDLMDSVTRLASNPETQSIPAEARGLLQDARTLVGSEEIRQALTDIQTATQEISTLATTVGDSEGLTTLLTALEQSETIVRNLATVSEGLPGLSEDVAEVVRDIGELPLGDLTRSATSTVARLQTLLADESIAQIAPSLASTLQEADTALQELRASGAIAQLDETLTSAATLTNSLTESAADIGPILDDIAVVVRDVQGLPLQDVVQSSNRVIERLETVLSADGIEDIPTTLSAALVELQSSLKELREGGAVSSLNATLANADAALQSVEEAARSLPALAQQLDGLASDFDSLIASYGERSRFNQDLRDAIRSATDAVDAIRSLARTIERNPNSLITGR
ncbi:intermembrane transport protein PqiB [Actibacterium sp. 188UL27-1]|uniref:PqiB family protein n=1 Tax=Actibacterium sp. 188UL27-1 TaxID=2786961 RepID=UPI00195E5761|nr:MlaD family protein [Actibacterium sp. 188UL27-1]MBM7067261.1 MCE family protein [Actibacterium sp. 188UL27-1]